MNEPAASTLATWRILLNAEADPAAAQRALLSLPEKTSFTFDADPTATSADLELLEGGSLMLAAGSPAAKAMIKNIHVGVKVVSADAVCLGVFNAKEVKVRNDPVVRACALPIEGRGSCTNTSHRSHRLQYTGKRLLIQTPVVSKATTAAFFSMPYLVVESLPDGPAIDRLCQLSAPVSKWRSFFDGTAEMLPTILEAASRAPNLRVVTSQDVPPSKSSEIHVEDVDSPSDLLETTTRRFVPPKKELSPMSYDMVEDAEGTDEFKDAVEATAPDPKVETDVKVMDFLDTTSQTTLIGRAASELGPKIGGADDYYNAEADKLSDEVVGLSLSGARGAPPACEDESDDDSIPLKQEDDVSSLRSASVYRPSPPDDGATHSVAKSYGPSPPNNPNYEGALLRQILMQQETLSNQVRSLALENQTLKDALKKTRAIAKQALSASASANVNATSTGTSLRKEMGLLKDEMIKAVLSRQMAVLDALRRDVTAVVAWKDSVDDRVSSVEMDIRDEDGLLLSLIRECRTAAAAGDASSFSVAGYTIQNEEAVLAMIQPLPGKNAYAVFTNMKTLFGLCGDAVTSLSENMLLHKATKSADFDDTYSARANTAAVVPFPPVFGRKSTSGDSNKMIWNSGWKSHAAFAGGMKNGGKATLERQIRKAVELCRGQIRRKLPPHQFQMQNAIANGMLDQASLACFDFLDGVSNFYHIMASTGLSPAAAWLTTLDMLMRVFEELEAVASEGGEEDVDAGLIWSSMQIAIKVSEFQRFRWTEHPCICAMLMFSVLERLGEVSDHPEDSAAAEALEQCRRNHEEIMELVERQKKDHEKAAEAVNQVKQLRDIVKNGKKEPKA